MPETVTDHHGNALQEGCRVWAWHGGTRFGARVKEILPWRPGDGDFRLIILTRDVDGTEASSFSDAVVVREGEG